jgi:hypothetical protein
MNPYLIFAVIGAALEIGGFIFAILNMGSAATSVFSGKFDRADSFFRRHLVSVAMCGIGSFILLITGIAFLISKLF